MNILEYNAVIKHEFIKCNKPHISANLLCEIQFNKLQDDKTDKIFEYIFACVYEYHFIFLIWFFFSIVILEATWNEEEENPKACKNVQRRYTY